MSNPYVASRDDVADDPRRARDELGWRSTVDVMDYIAAVRDR